MKRKLSFDEGEQSSDRLSKEWVEDERERDEECLDMKLGYDPTHFLRCHSKDKSDVADVSTQVWQCSFEPDPNNPSRTTDIVATCGGNSVCLINVMKGKVVRKYYSESKREIFFALAWTTHESYNGNANLLAVGGAQCSIHFLNPARNTMFLEHKIKDRRAKVHISSLLFHKEQSNILFCMLSIGKVLLFDIGSPLLPNCKNKIILLQTFVSSSNELFTLTLATELNILLAASDDGLLGWKVVPEDINNIKTKELKFHFPESKIATMSKCFVVDSVEALDGHLIATKCALHGLIYIWNLESTLKGAKHNDSSYAVVPIQMLRWSDTDNFYMGMGYDRESSLLACGDDKGAIWLYSLTIKNKTCETVDPDTILEWPDVTDEYIASKRKLKLNVYDIVVDKVTVGYQGKYLVAVTANNMVCIWQRVEG